MDCDEARRLGWRIRRLRDARGKSLRVIAGLAGMSTTHLWRIEVGQRSPNLAQIAALADALQIAPAELIELRAPAPADRDTDSAIQEVRLAVMAAARHRPGGLVLAVEMLRTRVTALLDAHNRCDREAEIRDALPPLIRDLHTSIAAGRDVAELRDLAVLLHANATVGWLRVAGAAVELRELAAGLASRAAEERDTPQARGLAVWGGVYVLLQAGAVDLARAELDSVRVPTCTPAGMQLAGALALCRSYLAALDSRSGEAEACLEHAAELAERTREINACGLGFGPQDVGAWRVRAALETGDHERAVQIAEGLQPEAHLLRARQPDYWVAYGQALARLRGRQQDAVTAFRAAERISPHHVRRDPVTREVLGELLSRTRRDSPAGRALRSMAYWVGLPGWSTGREPENLTRPR